ncbi:heavy metal-responsive transcriptional regulator [Nocardioides sp. OK12]|uniref:heavy metal-responsive transcriptional regulator n=1 Tax=Nocardioides sp. OK12 TaxID=2758661 RepID=UPI0021C49F52|nr:heavy metal-responsive transcriptional regulator [Nocardioides sp. OK12]
MRIGEVAEQSGLAPQTIRFYEREGLLPEPARGPNGYREYDATVLGRLAFVRGAQAAGLSLAEIASILDLRREGAVPCSHVQSLLHARLAEVRARRRELEELEVDLEGLLVRSEGLDPADCSDAQVCHVIAAERR